MENREPRRRVPGKIARRRASREVGRRGGFDGEVI